MIVGRVYDDFGEPASEVRVTALSVHYPSPGFRQVASAGTDTTNDLGEFRIYGLPRGTYYVAAANSSMRLGSDQASGSGSGAGSGLASAYHPGVTDPSSAGPIQVAAGGNPAIADIQLIGTPLARVQGQVADSRGRPVSGAVAMLNSARADDLVAPIIVEADSQGRFAFANVVPGDYRLDVEHQEVLLAIAKSGQASGRPQDAGAPEFASVPLRVEGRDIDGVTVALSSGRSVSGRVMVRGGALSAEVLARVTVSVEAVIPGQGISAGLQRASGPATADGAFHVRGVLGRRVIRVAGLPEGWFLDRVTSFGVDVTDEGIDVEHADITNVDVVVTNSATQITGSVADAAGRAQIAAAVVVFPEDARLWTHPRNRYLMATSTDNTGTFRIRALPPGRYHIVALAALEQFDWADPAELARLREHAVSVTLAQGEERSLVLPLSVGPQ